MSQFGYAEEQGENKARADIYAVISPPPIPPGTRRPMERMLPRCKCRRTSVVVVVASSPTQLFTWKQPRGVTT